MARAPVKAYPGWESDTGSWHVKHPPGSGEREGVVHAVGTSAQNGQGWSRAVARAAREAVATT